MKMASHSQGDDMDRKQKYEYMSKIVDEGAKKVIHDLGVPHDQVVEWEEAFLLLDEDHSGQIDTEEVAHLMRLLHHDPKESDVKQMIAEVDVSGDGVIDFGEFIRLMWKHHCKEIDYHTQLREAFAVFDRDGNGKIEKDELKDIMTNLGDEPVTDEEVEYMIQQADLNHDGKIDFEEFSRMMRALDP